MDEEPLPAESLAKLPNEPGRSRLATTGPIPHQVAAGTPLWRVYARGGEHPLP